MKIYLKFIKYYLNLLSFIAPKHGGKIAVRIFQKVRIKKIKEIETDFYKKAKHFKIKRKNAEELHCYEFGDPNGKLIFLVHGWNSNAGSLTRFAFEFAKKGYRIISFDLPAHANTKGSHTNLFDCKNAFKDLLKYINPKAPFHVISHSFGSAVIAFALSETNNKAEKIILLSANNSLKEIFLEFQQFIGFNNTIFKHVAFWIKDIMKEDLSKMTIINRLKKVSFGKMLIIHDKFDKVIPYKNAEKISKEINQTILKSFEKIGHYRMLWNKEVIKESLNFIHKIKTS